MNALVNIRSRNRRPVKELVVISGKGGTGKTSLAASFAALAKMAVLADCDVDAADLHLLAAPRIIRGEPFTGGKHAWIDPGSCTACGQCEELCRFDAIHLDGPGNIAFPATCRVERTACEGCGVCAWFCPTQAIQLKPTVSGEWFESDTRFGPMVHARLGAGEENSGKLVSLVRATARSIAEERGIDLVVVDGSPGIGCPVIASITGADLVLIVAEPTPSGLHDMERVASLTHYFGVPAAVCVNKWDLNPCIGESIEARALEQDMTLAGRIRYDPAVTEAQVDGMALVEYTRRGSATDVRQTWRRLASALFESTVNHAARPRPQEFSSHAVRGR